MNKQSDIPYVESGHERQVLDVYRPEETDRKSLPVMIWIHGGGWESGDKSEVALKPKIFTERGYIFVSINHRFLPEVKMGELIRDVAKALGWVSRNIGESGGDPTRILIGGHSSGAQLAALLCTDDRYLREVGVSSEVIKGCVPVDGDTFDIPKIILTAEMRQDLYGGAPFTFGHRQKFENDPDKHLEYSAVTHVAKGKTIPPFLILYFSGNPDTTAQALRLGEMLNGADIPAMMCRQSHTHHEQLNDALGEAGDSATEALYRFLDELEITVSS